MCVCVCVCVFKECKTLATMHVNYCQYNVEIIRKGSVCVRAGGGGGGGIRICGGRGACGVICFAGDVTSMSSFGRDRMCRSEPKDSPRGDVSRMDSHMATLQSSSP